jgi:hypothetical protein
MNRIYLDKLFEFAYGTYSINYGQYTKHIELTNEINKIKQNTSLNEKGTFIKYSYLDLSSLVSSIEYNECVLIYPLCFNIEENQEWNNFLNCLLLILNDDYLKETNIAKKKILQIADKMYRKHLKIDKTLNSHNFEKISELTDLNIVIISNENNILDIVEYNNKTKTNTKTLSDKWIVCYKYENDYFPVWNFEKKYYTSSSNFIKYLQDFIIKKKYISATKPQIVKKVSDKDTLLQSNGAYEELVTNEDYALYLSEAVDTKKQKIKKKIETNSFGEKKKNKTNKDIFVALEQDDNIKSNTHKNKPVDISESVFKKTEVIDISKVKHILSCIKTTTKLEQIQAYALEVGLLISSGSTKDGKPKNKTKNELIDDIKNLEKTI